MKNKKNGKQNFSDDGAFSFSIGSMLGMTAQKTQEDKADKEEKKDKDVKAKEENKNADANAKKIPPKASLQRQTAGRGGKVVTIVILPKDSNADIDRIAKQMKKGLGCGAKIEDGKIVLQGDIADRAEQWLQRAGVKKIVK